MQNEYALDFGGFDANPIFSNLQHGAYTITARNRYGCMDTALLTIDSSYLPEPIVHVTDVRCFGDSTGALKFYVAVGHTPYNYFISGIEIPDSIGRLPAGHYDFIAIDEKGCEAAFAATVSSPPELVIQAGLLNDSVCIGTSTGSFHIIPSGGTQPYTISVNGQAPTSDTTFEDLAAGPYHLTLIDSQHCQSQLQVDIVNYPVLQLGDHVISHDTCGLGKGEILIASMVNGLPPMEYALDGGTFGDDAHFKELSTGRHTVVVRDARQCLDTSTLTVVYLDSVTFEDALLTHTSCGESNGQVHLVTSTDIGNIYVVDAIDTFDVPAIDHLTAGDHIIEVWNRYGCHDQVMISIANSTSMEYDVEDILLACTTDPDTTVVSLSGGRPPYRYRLNDGSWISDPEFLNVPLGANEIAVMDADSCLMVIPHDKLESKPLYLSSHHIDETVCGGATGKAQIHVAGGSGAITLLYNDESFQDVAYLENLMEGPFLVIASDSRFCRDSFEFVVSSTCRVYVPTSFSPNDDGINDVFQVFSNADARAEIVQYDIYDRWGGLVYQRSGFSLRNNELWWNGNSNGQPCADGLYVYMIKVQFDNGQHIDLSGEVQLLR